MPRPPILDDAKRREICALLTAGLAFTEAARYVGCTRRTISREIRRNADFRRTVHDALLSARLAPEKLLRQAAGRNWRAAAWLLERTDPHVYARRSPTECTLEDLEATCRWIIDAAMHAVDCQRRDALFDELAAVVDDARSQIRNRANPRKPIRTPQTAFYDVADMLRQARREPFDRAVKSPGGQIREDKTHPSIVRLSAREAPGNVGRQPTSTGQN